MKCKLPFSFKQKLLQSSLGSVTTLHKAMIAEKQQLWQSVNLDIAKKNCDLIYQTLIRPQVETDNRN